MPSTQPPGDQTTQVFRRHFLEAGGLKYVLNVLQSSNFPSSMDIAIRQDLYAVALSLTKCLLCAPPIQPELSDQTEGDVEEVEVMEDQNETHPPLAVRQMSKTRSVEDEVARLTIEVL